MSIEIPGIKTEHGPSAGYKGGRGRLLQQPDSFTLSAVFAPADGSFHKEDIFELNQT